MVSHIKILEQVASSFSAPAQGVEQFDSKVCLSSFGTVLQNFERDCEEVQSRLSFLLQADSDLHENRRLSKLIVEDIEARTFRASTTSILSFALESTEVEDPGLIRLVLGAGLLADIPHNLPYHGTRHFRKVVFHMLRFIFAFDHIENAELNNLNNNQKALLLCAAAVHDLGHDGGGNVRGVSYEMAYLEKRSYEIARTFLSVLNVSSSFFDDLETLLFATDTSMAARGNSPADQIRLLYMHHFSNGDFVVSLDNIHAPLVELKDDEQLALLCVLMHEADIFNSAAVDYSVMIEEAKNVFAEIGYDHVRPSNCLDFFESTCHGRLYTKVSRYLGQDVFDEILMRVRDDVAKGDAHYS